MEIEIRKAGVEELDDLMEWRMRVLHEVFGIPEPEKMTELSEENRLYYLSEIPQGGHIACFAYCGGTIAGCGGICIYREMPSPDNRNGLCGYLMNIYTAPEFRGQGIGRRIVKWLVNYAKEKQVSKIYLESSKEGKKLYRELGFKEMKDYLKFSETGDL